MKRIVLIIIISIFIALIIVLFIWPGFVTNAYKMSGAGSYPNVETWSFDVEESELIEIIEKIKNTHPELKEPNSTSTDERHRYWYKITFYYSDTNEDVYTWTRPNEDGVSTTFALVAIASHIDAKTPVKDIKLDRKEINSDFGYWENRREIKKFENTIVKLIEQKINQE